MVIDLDMHATKLGQLALNSYGAGTVEWYYQLLMKKRDAAAMKSKLFAFDITMEEMDAGFATIGLMWMMLGGYSKVTATPGLAKEALPNIVAAGLLKTIELATARHTLRN